MHRGTGITKVGRIFLFVFVMIVCSLSDYGVFSRTYGADVSRDSTTESLINQNFDKVDYFLRKKLEQMTSNGSESQGKVKFSASLNLNAMTLSDSEDRIQVYIYVHTMEPDVKSILESYGAIVEIFNENLNAVQAWIPQDRVYQIAQLSFIKRISNPSYAVFRNSDNAPARRSLLSGSVTTEGDAILRANEVRARGLNGSGAKVGVITDGVTSRASAIVSGDLPSNMTVLREGNGDEGTALLEIVYDIAPGAELAFCGVATSMEMIECVNALATTFSADIIIDDAAFLMSRILKTALSLRL